MSTPVTELGLPLRTERLVLRPFTSGDVDDLFAYRGLPEVTRFLHRPPWTRPGTAEVVRQAAERGLDGSGEPLVLGVTVAGEDRVIGDIQLLSEPGSGQGEVGWVFHPDVAGRGYATESARRLIELAFDVVGLHRVFARLDAANDASVRLCERLGMRQEAHFVENVRDGEQWVSELIYAQLDREWAARRDG